MHIRVELMCFIAANTFLREVQTNMQSSIRYDIRGTYLKHYFFFFFLILNHSHVYIEQ